MGGQNTRTAIATGTCATLGVALAVSLGVVPRATGGEHGLLPMASISQVGSDVLRGTPVPQTGAKHPSNHAASVSRHQARIRSSASTSSLAVAPAVQTAAEDVSTNTAAVTSVTQQPAAKTPAPKKHPKRKAHHKKKVHPKKPATPKRAPRTTPSAAAVSSAIAGLKQYVHTPFTPTSSQVAEFGDEVCSAFDQNETLAHVESVILQKVKSIPFTTVESGAAGYVVKTAVHLYCPGYSSKLG